MSEKTDKTPKEDKKEPVGTLVDLVTGVDEGNPLGVDISVKMDGKVVIFHDKPFKETLAWMEFDLNTRNLDFVIEGGELRDFGRPLEKEISINMQNTHQILTILMDDDTGEAKEGNYIPLIVHRSE